MTQAVKRACDACHRRKVKCDGISPCRNCHTATLSCTYNAVPQKKGPKGSRAKVISELRETQRQTSLSAKVQSRISGAAAPSAGPSPTPGLMTPEMIKQCVQFYFDNLYAQMPILNRQQIEQQMLSLEQNRDAYCLMTSLCALVMLQPGMTMPRGDPFGLDAMPGVTIAAAQILIEETLRVRNGYEYLDNINMNVLGTNYFLFACYYAQEMHDRAWYYLREATTMIHLCGINKEEHYLQLDTTESSRRRRLFWLFYATERAYAIQRNRPLTLQATINLPTMNDDPTDSASSQLGSFVLLARIFKPFDDAFTAVWNKTRGAWSGPYISNLQKQLGELIGPYLCQDSNLADFHTNQQWLKSTVWQLNNNIPNNGGDDSLSFRFPSNLTRDMRSNMLSNLSSQGMDLQSSGLVENLLDIAQLVAEYLTLQPAPRDPFAVGPSRHLEELLSSVAISRTGGDHRFLPLLMIKISEIIPRFVNPKLQDAPPPDLSTLSQIDMFDGFGTAGMAQPPPQMQLPLESEYEHSFSPEYEKKYAVEMNSNTPESATNSTTSNPARQQAPDMGSSFVNSPPIMSPGIEFQPNMNGFACTPMSEMVMSPLGNPGQQNHMNTPGQPQHHQHQHMGQHQMGGMPTHMHSQGMNTSMTSHPMNSNMGGMRQAPQRQGSFNLSCPPQMRTVGDFQGLQRAGSDASSMVNMKPMPQAEIDFGAIR